MDATTDAQEAGGVNRLGSVVRFGHASPWIAGMANQSGSLDGDIRTGGGHYGYRVRFCCAVSAPDAGSGF